MGNKNKQVKELKKHKSLIGAGMPRSARMKNLRGTNNKFEYSSNLTVISSTIGINKAQEIINNILEIIKDKTGQTDVTEDKTIEGLDLDSIDMVDITLALESKFGISIPDQDARNFNKVGDIINYVANKN